MGSALASQDARCHCGTPLVARDPDPWDGRMDAYCEPCSLNRCDCYPHECPVKYPAPVLDTSLSSEVAAECNDAGAGVG